MQSPPSVSLFAAALQLFISIALTAAGQVFLKIGVDSRFGVPSNTLPNLFSAWILAGVLAMLVSLLSWLYALKSVPLVIAFNLAATNHIMVAIASRIFLGEQISIRRRDKHLSIGLERPIKTALHLGRREALQHPPDRIRDVSPVEFLFPNCPFCDSAPKCSNGFSIDKIHDQASHRRDA